MAKNVQQNLDTWKSKLDKILHEKNAVTDLLEKVEQKTGVRRLYIVLGFAVLMGLYLMIGYGAQFICNFLGFLYPAYASIKAIETKEKDDDTKWLTYWVVYSTFALLEFFTDIFLFWVPFYWFFKCVFLVYCMAPAKWNGSVTIYHKVIRPLFLRHQQKVDEALDKAANVAKDVMDEAEEAGKNAAADASAEMIRRQFDEAKMD